MRYLPEQISSLTSQTGVTFSIEAQDDGSTDGTYEYLELLAEYHPVDKLMRSNQIGSSAVFMNLLNQAGVADYYAFCDQDDIWETNKLEKLIALFNSPNLPEIAFSGRVVISSKNKILKLDKVDSKRIGIQNALIQNSMPGNTMVISKEGRNFLVSLDYSGVRHYDSWIYLAFSTFGKIHLSHDLLTNYRIHDDNQVGYGGNWFHKIAHAEKNLANFKFNAQSLTGIQRNLPMQNNMVFLQHFIDLLSTKNLILRFLLLKKLKLTRKSKLQTLLISLYLLFRLN